MAGPFFIARLSLGERYRGILPILANDEYFYMARIQDGIDGHPLLSNAYVWEHKDGVPQQLFLVEYLLAKPLSWLDLNAAQGRVLYGIILPMAVIGLIYSIGYVMSRSRAIALVVAVFVGLSILLFEIMRPVSPQANLLFWLTQTALLWLYLQRPRHLLFVLNIINLGLLFYIYPYYWTFYYAVLGVMAVIYFFYQRIWTWRISGIMLGGTLLGLPYFYLVYRAGQSPDYTETLIRLQMIYTRFPSAFYVVGISLLGLIGLAIALRRRWVSVRREAIFFAAGFLGLIIASNQHIVTGKHFEFSSHYLLIALLWAVFAGVFLLSHLPSRYRTSPWVIFLIIVIMTSIGIPHGARYIAMLRNLSHADSASQRYGAVFDWLNDQTLIDSVVYTHEDMASMIPAYTHNNVFYARNANLFFISDAEVRERFLLNNAFENIDRDFIIRHERSLFGVQYVDHYGHAVQSNKLRRLLGMSVVPEIRLPEEAIASVLAQNDQLRKENLVARLRRYRIDYVIWDTQKNPDWKLPTVLMKKIFETSGIVVYQFEATDRK